jgi:hypothetical protein
LFHFYIINKKIKKGGKILDITGLFLMFILRTFIKTLLLGILIKIAWKFGGFLFKSIAVIAIVLFIASFLF